MRRLLPDGPSGQPYLTTADEPNRETVPDVFPFHHPSGMRSPLLGMDAPITKKQVHQLINELKRFNDIFLVFVQNQGVDFAAKYPMQELPKVRKPAS